MLKQILICAAVTTVCAGAVALRLSGVWDAYIGNANNPALSTAVPSVSAVPEETAKPGGEAPQTAVPEPTQAPTQAPRQTDFSKYDALSTKSSGWGFKKNKNAEPDIPEATKKLLANYQGYYIDPEKPKALYLTFDEGYENGYTASILDTLKEHQVPAAFFVTGPYIEREEELVRRMLSEGHIVGNHTVNHPNLAKISVQEVYKELNDLAETFEAKYGKGMCYMRPPEGEHSEKMLSVAADMGYKTIFWSFAYKDWDVNAQKGADYAYDQVTPYLHDGAILLLHAVSSDNAEALGQILEYAKEQGYEFRSLDELSQYPAAEQSTPAA